MSKIVRKKDLTSDDLIHLYKECKVSTIKNAFNMYPKPIKLFGDDGENFWIPRGIAISGFSYKDFYSLKEYSAKFNVHRSLLTEATDPLDLGRDQHMVFASALSELGDNGTCFLELSTGFGKTTMGTHIIHALERKACIIVFSQTLQSDWVKDLKNHTDARVHLYTGNKIPPNNSQIDIIGLKKASSLSVEFLSRYQTVVIDEIDQVLGKQYMKLLLKIAPDYFIGMTATVERSDGLHKAFYKYFDKFITRFIEKPDATVIKFQTEFVAEEEYDNEGTLIDSVLMNSIAENKQRHLSVERLVRSLGKKPMLILSGRISEILAIYELIKDLDVDYKTDKKKHFDKSKQILIGGFKSFGRGFDRPGLEVVIMLSSYRNVKQYEGRLRSDCGFIYDFVDKNFIFESRWKTRVSWYNKRKMIIKYQIDGTSEVLDMPKRTRLAPMKNFLPDI